jgi:D-hydroxyproline dehydrogenase subunit gamma
MFRRLAEPPAPRIGFTLDGVAVAGAEGDTVAAAVLALGHAACRETAISGVPRGPYCLMGACFDCLLVIDGIGNRQGCMVPLQEGMAVETQRGRREVGR